jgi:hypothetical protein
MKLARPLAVAAVTAVVALGVAAPEAAHADKPGSEPCATQQAQADKAEAALARVTAVFEHQQTKVERLQAQLAAATTDEEKAKIQAKLDKALAHKQHAKKAKKAQMQRVAKAEQRLEDCLAAQ